MKLTVATCQFPTDAEVRRNYHHITAQMTEAKQRGAHVAHFPEASLSGYAGADLSSYEGFDWDSLEQSTRDILALARDLQLWVVLGSVHRLSPPHKPHNSLYIINAAGEIVDRYDKLFCAGDADSQTGDLAHYSPGNHFCVFEIEGVRCGTLICHDYRYPELYREYKRRGVQLMFHSYHAGHVPAARLAAIQAGIGVENWPYNPALTLPGITMPATMHSYAANNFMWISCPNSSARESCWASFFVRPDGVATGQVPLHTTGLLLSTVDTDEPLYDSTVAWRERAMNGVYHSGVLVDDPRSARRTQL